jgi:Peptidase family M23
MRLRLLLTLLPALLLPMIGPPRAAHAASSWQWPLPAPHQVVHGFDPPAHDWLAGHRGVDLAAVVGQPVLAAGAGTVSFAGRVGGIGVVAIRHSGGLETTYEPVRASVHVGARVLTGTRLGVVVPHGSHCAPQVCLHWGLRRGSDYLDPLVLVGAARVRLLPMLAGASGSWVVPAASGASVGSSVVVVGWAVAIGRKRRRRLPPGVASLEHARAKREPVSSCCARCSR